MSVLKLSQITLAGSAPALTDTLIGVQQSGPNDLQYTLAQVATTIAGTSSITINTTTITGGTSGRVLYDNAGTVGEASFATITNSSFTGFNVATGSYYLYNNNGLAYADTTNDCWFFASAGPGPGISFSGQHNLAMGSGALLNLNSGTGALNVAIGRLAGSQITNGLHNFCFGSGSLQNVTTGNDNVGLGYNTLLSASGAETGNLAIGTSSLAFMVGGSFNVCIGMTAAGNVTNGGFGDNVGIGASAFGGVTSGAAFYNVAIGASCMSSFTAGSGNTWLGGGITPSGSVSQTIALGTNNQFGSAPTIQLDYNYTNSGLWTFASGADFGGSINVPAGDAYLYGGNKYLWNGGDSTSFAAGTTLGGLTFGSSSFNLAIGNNAMGAGALTSAFGNVAIGYNALQSVTSARNCVAIGAGALASLTNSIDSVAIGQNAGNKLTGGSSVFLGTSAGINVTSGVANMLIGANAGGNLTGSDSNNVAIGQGVALTAGSSGNTMIGTAAATNASNALTENTCIGYFSGLNLATSGGATNNVFIGYGCGVTVTGGNGNTWIGSIQPASSNTYSNTIGIGTGTYPGTIQLDYNYTNSGLWTFAAPPVVPGYVFGSLPTPVVGAMARITDGPAGLVNGNTASGGHGTPYLVWYNGTNWTVVGE